jgi:hypothetical protein
VSERVREKGREIGESGEREKERLKEVETGRDWECAIVLILLRNSPVRFHDLLHHDDALFLGMNDALQRTAEELSEMRFVGPLYGGKEVSIGTMICTRGGLMCSPLQDPLMENGQDVVVTPDNVREFVSLYSKHVLVEQRRRALEALRDGFQFALFWESIKNFVSVFSADDLSYALEGCGKV